MKNIRISDNTIRHASRKEGTDVSFKIKVDIARRLDRVGVSCIETSRITDPQEDFLLVKSIASAVENATLTVPVYIMDESSVSLTWEALKGAAHPRLQVPAPCSTVQMEYFCHEKPAEMLERIRRNVSGCAALCDEVEFVALDFTRSEESFLHEAIRTAVEAGARIVTMSDVAGNLLPEEFFEAVKAVKAVLPQGIELGVQCSNEYALADTCSIAAVRAGADEIKTSVFGRTSASVARICKILGARAETLGARTSIRATELDTACEDIKKMCISYKDNPHGVFSPETDAPCEEADCAEPVPETYHLETFLINSGNIISSTCHLRLRKGTQTLESVCVGNGPVDASFQALEKLVGVRYELDDFKIRSVTEGYEAMGETVIKLRYKGRQYSGKGISTDIVGSSILAYLDAANKIAYEEDKA